MSTTSINTNWHTNAPGSVYLLDAPAANPGSDLTFANVVKGYFGLFYLDGDKKTTMKGGVSPWANLLSSGISLKITGDPLEFTSNYGIKSIVAQKAVSVSGEFSFSDADAAHMMDCLSVAAGSKLTVAAATGTPGQTITPVGLNKLKSYTLMYQYESATAPGEFNNILIPKVKIVPDFSLELSADKLIELKVKFTAEADAWCIDPVSLKPVQALYQEATAIRL